RTVWRPAMCRTIPPWRSEKTLSQWDFVTCVMERGRSKRLNRSAADYEIDQDQYRHEGDQPDENFSPEHTRVILFWRRRLLWRGTRFGRELRQGIERVGHGCAVRTLVTASPHMSGELRRGHAANPSRQRNGFALMGQGRCHASRSRMFTQIACA